VSDHSCIVHLEACIIQYVSQIAIQINTKKSLKLKRRRHMDCHDFWGDRDETGEITFMSDFSCNKQASATAGGWVFMIFSN
jgi:hypothetical protein